MNGALYKTPLIRTKGRGVNGKKLNKYILKNKVDAYLKLWDEKRKELGIECEYLFVTKENGEYVQAKESTANSFVDTCSKLMDMDIYNHCLRHKYVTYLKEQGLPLDVIADIVGHNDTSTTKLYDDTPTENSFLKYFSEDGIVKQESKNLSDL